MINGAWYQYNCVLTGGLFLFSFCISPQYPHDAPKVKCLTKVYHPNIDLEGNICLNILREDWKPVLSISAVIYGLQFLFLVSENNNNSNNNNNNNRNNNNKK